MIPACHTPLARAASTNSQFLRLRTCPRTMRAMVSPEELEEEYHHEDEGDDVEHVDHPHHERVDLPAEVAAHRPVDHADGERDRGGEQADEQRDPPAVHRPHEQIAAVHVGAEPVLPRRPLRAVGEILLIEGPRHQQWPDHHEEEHRREQAAGEDRHPVLPEAPPRVLPERGALHLLLDRHRRVHSYLTRGSSTPRARSTRRLATSRKIASTTTTAIARVMSRLSAASTK